MNTTLKECDPIVDLQSSVTRLGGLAVAVAKGRLAVVAFGHRTAAAAERDVARRLRELGEISAGAIKNPVDVQSALELLCDYADGQVVDFTNVPVLDHWKTPFQQRVIAACRKITRGQTQTYGQLAEQVGNPGAARAVGTVMSSNPLPLVVPCHRVLAAGGGLGGYSARQGLAMKRRLLVSEGAYPAE